MHGRVSVAALSLIVLLSCASASAQVTEDWVASFNGSANNADNAYAMTLDTQGNVVVVGEARTGPTTNDVDIAVVKYSQGGDTLWIQYFNGNQNKRDVARAVACDDSGNVYVAGESYGTSNYDMVLVKFDADGNPQWSRRYNGAADGEDGAMAVAVSGLGDVYVVGYSDGDASPVLRQDDMITAKYSSSGALLWIKRYDGPSGFHDIGRALAVDAAGSVYVTGESSGIGTGYDYVTIKYSAAGDSVWGQRYSEAGSSTDKATALYLDNDGNTYVTGSSVIGTGSEDFMTIKYGPTGTPMWYARYAGPGGGDDAFDITGDGGSNIYVTGDSRGPGPAYTYDFLTIRYDAATGDTLWTARYDGDGKGFDAALSVCTNPHGDVFVAGYSTGNSSGYDFATIRYDSSGTFRWAQRYTSSGSFSDIAFAVQLDTAGHIFVAGRAYAGSELNNFVTIRYTDSGSPAAVDRLGSGSPDVWELEDNYPNPFNPSTTISFTIARSTFVRLTVYDMIGREVGTLVEDDLVAGRYSVVWNASGAASGLYLCRISADGFVATKKLLLIK